jgi:hypothetical protein
MLWAAHIKPQKCADHVFSRAQLLHVAPQKMRVNGHVEQGEPGERNRGNRLFSGCTGRSARIRAGCVAFGEPRNDFLNRLRDGGANTQFPLDNLPKSGMDAEKFVYRNQSLRPV